MVSELSADTRFEFDHLKPSFGAGMRLCQGSGFPDFFLTRGQIGILHRPEQEPWENAVIFFKFRTGDNNCNQRRTRGGVLRLLQSARFPERAGLVVL